MTKKVLLAALLAVGAALAAHGASAQELTGTLKKIKDTGKVTMGVRDSSGVLSYTLGNGQYAGFHVNLCQNLLADLQKQLKLPKLNIEYMSVTSSNRIPLVENGTVDLECGSTTNNVARQKQVAFGLTTYVTEVRMAVRAGQRLYSVAQLDGKTVATTTGTTSVQTLRKSERGQNIKFNEVYGKDHAESFLLLESGRADAFVMDDYILAGNIANSKDPKQFDIVGEPLSVEPIAIMFRKDDPAFKTAVDDYIRKTMKSGEFEKLYNKWFMSPIPPKNNNPGVPMSQRLKDAIANPNDKPMEDYAAKKS
ncbi:amino acid ABC transporter substrate-binding protein [Derxia gummosa]|uniref:Amino acid ABC transporter substrate-binding protein n=1 Tax=Derxia gummosa DSM 723 TaxID=1121388 RepID=A0A8B6X6V6_9BURK|nr:amino acid ABC transporter substrate-binding protein [Derxia gummosa]